jgi:GDP-L-fucose synthase
VSSPDFYRGVRVLVTGGTGFIGRHLAAQLLELGADVAVPVHERPLPPELADATAIAADLTRADDCLRVTRDMDVVIHAAGAVAGAGAAKADAVAGITTNLVLTARVLQAVAANRVSRCLVFSSSTVYPALDRPVREEDVDSGPPHPAYAGYGSMRRYFERLAEVVSRDAGVHVAVVRPTAVYGRHDNFDPATSHFVAALVRRAVLRERPFEVWGTGAETRDLLHVSDFARGCLLALEKQPSADPINIGYGAPVTVREVVQLILDAADYRDAEVVFNASRPGTIGSRSVDCSKARQRLGFTPEISLQEGIADTVRWYAQALGAGLAHPS